MNIKIKIYKDRIQRPLVPRFFHDRRQTNFLKDLIFIGEKQTSLRNFLNLKLEEKNNMNKENKEHQIKEVLNIDRKESISLFQKNI